VNAVRQALLRGKRRPRNAGAGSATLYRGDGYEFVELREYVPGDDVRRIDWAATARSGALQTRVVLEDVALTIAAILDTSASMQSGRQQPLAQSAHEIVEMWFGAAASGDRTYRVTSEGVVAPWAAGGDEPFSFCRALEVAAAVLRAGTALLVVSDFFDLPQDDELLVLLGRRFDCTALIARDPWRDGLPLSGFVRARDSENGALAALFIGQAERRRYARAVRERENQLLRRLSDCNWRTGLFDEHDGGAALLRAFAVR
jgi:uncharacterized protein (DUF58 family)